MGVTPMTMPSVREFLQVPTPQPPSHRRRRQAMSNPPAPAPAPPNTRSIPTRSESTGIHTPRHPIVHHQYGRLDATITFDVFPLDNSVLHHGDFLRKRHYVEYKASRIGEKIRKAYCSIMEHDHQYPYDPRLPVISTLQQMPPTPVRHALRERGFTIPIVIIPPPEEAAATGI
ncbi:hypothetical protein FRC03_008575 [Tulasnella sp. 419]|nr:hypothetical protein FRC03_008575 [Tulasnella sp. 419]